jgi:hypothetical protein
MKLYRSKVPVIAAECIQRLVQDGDIEIEPERRADAEADLVAIMEDHLRRDNDLRDAIRDRMSRGGIPYDQYGKVRNELAEKRAHPTNDDIERYLARQFAEALMISPSIDEVFADDQVLYKKLLIVVRSHDVDEAGIRDEAAQKVKNVREGTVEYEIAFEAAVREVKKRKGLI